MKLILLLILNCLTAGPATRPSGAPSTQPAIEQLDVHIPSQARDMTYFLRRPAGYGKADRPALLIVLHGTDDLAQEAMQFWSSRTHEVPFLLAAPQAIGKGWRDEDVASLRAMLEDLRLQAPHDPERVMLAGFSAGGVMTMYMLYQENWPVCAAAALANYVPPRLTSDQIRPHKDVPVFYAVGMSDINHEKMRVGLELLRTSGANVDLYRPSIGHVLDPQVGQVAMDWLMLRARRQVTAQIDAVKNTSSPEAAAMLERVVAQRRWHDRANVDSAERALEKMEVAGRDKLQEIDAAVREGRKAEALDLLTAAEPQCISPRLRDRARSIRDAILSDPAVEQQYRERQKKLRDDSALKLYAQAQRLVADRKYQDAMLRCDEVLQKYGDTPSAARARFLQGLLRENHLVQ